MYTVTCTGLPEGYSIVDYARAAGVSLHHDTLEEARAAGVALEATPDCDGVAPNCSVLGPDGTEYPLMPPAVNADDWSRAHPETLAHGAWDRRSRS